MEFLLCQFLCFGLYGYGVRTMGNLTKGLCKDLITALLGLLILTLAAWLGLPSLGWVLVSALFLAYTFFYDQELFAFQWRNTILPGLALAGLWTLVQVTKGPCPHGLLPPVLDAPPAACSVSVTLGSCFLLQCQLAWKREQLSAWTATVWGAMYLALSVWSHKFSEPLFCLGLGVGLFFVLEYTLRRYQSGYERNTRDFQTSVLAHQYEEIKTIYLNMRGWRHDYHNHIQVMKAHMALGQMEALSGYLDALEQELSRVDAYVKSGNLMIDAILNSKLSRLGSRKLRYTVRQPCRSVCPFPMWICASFWAICWTMPLRPVRRLPRKSAFFESTVPLSKTSCIFPFKTLPRKNWTLMSGIISPKNEAITAWV